MGNPYDEPKETCPYCGDDMEADFVDNGIGMVQCGPYHCYSCGASEIGPELDDWRYKDRDGETIWLPDFGPPVLRHDAPFTKEELDTGYYKGRISPYANTVEGELVDHKTAKKAYGKGLLDEKKI